LFTSLFQDKEVNGFGQSPIEKITKRLFEAQLNKISKMSKKENGVWGKAPRYETKIDNLRTRWLI
jgi:hypothetical protein